MLLVIHLKRLVTLTVVVLLLALAVTGSGCIGSNKNTANGSTQTRTQNSVSVTVNSISPAIGYGKATSTLVLKVTGSGVTVQNVNAENLENWKVISSSNGQIKIQLTFASSRTIKSSIPIHITLSTPNGIKTINANVLVNIKVPHFGKFQLVTKKLVLSAGASDLEFKFIPTDNLNYTIKSAKIVLDSWLKLVGTKVNGYDVDFKVALNSVPPYGDTGSFIVKTYFTVVSGSIVKTIPYFAVVNYEVVKGGVSNNSGQTVGYIVHYEVLNNNNGQYSVSEEKNTTLEQFIKDVNGMIELGWTNGEYCYVSPKKPSYYGYTIPHIDVTSITAGESFSETSLKEAINETLGNGDNALYVIIGCSSSPELVYAVIEKAPASNSSASGNGENNGGGNGNSVPVSGNIKLLGSWKGIYEGHYVYLIAFNSNVSSDLKVTSNGKSVYFFNALGETYDPAIYGDISNVKYRYDYVKLGLNNVYIVSDTPLSGVTLTLTDKTTGNVITSFTVNKFNTTYGIPSLDYDGALNKFADNKPILLSGDDVSATGITSYVMGAFTSIMLLSFYSYNMTTPNGLDILDTPMNITPTIYIPYNGGEPEYQSLSVEVVAPTVGFTKIVTAKPVGTVISDGVKYAVYTAGSVTIPFNGRIDLDPVLVRAYDSNGNLVVSEKMMMSFINVFFENKKWNYFDPADEPVITFTLGIDNATKEELKEENITTINKGYVCFGKKSDSYTLVFKEENVSTKDLVFNTNDNRLPVVWLWSNDVSFFGDETSSETLSEVLPMVGIILPQISTEENHFEAFDIKDWGLYTSDKTFGTSEKDEFEPVTVDDPVKYNLFIANLNQSNTQQSETGSNSVGLSLQSNNDEFTGINLVAFNPKKVTSVSIIGSDGKMYNVQEWDNPVRGMAELIQSNLMNQNTGYGNTSSINFNGAYYFRSFNGAVVMTVIPPVNVKPVKLVITYNDGTKQLIDLTKFGDSLLKSSAIPPMSDFQLYLSYIAFENSTNGE